MSDTPHPVPPGPSRRRVGLRRTLPAPLAAGLVAASLLLAGCGGSSHRTQVASLPGHSNHPASSRGSASGTAPDPDGRPRETLEATNAQQAALYDPYLACLRAHNYVNAQGTSAQTAINAKCLHLEPLAPWQLDPNNPQARAFIGRVVTCLMNKGYHAQAMLISNDIIEPPEWFVHYSPQALNYTPHRPVAAEDACRQKANG